MKNLFLGWLAILFIAFFVGMFAFEGHGTTESVLFYPWLITFFAGLAFWMFLILKGKFK